MFEVAKKLDGKRCLLVIDDVWNAQDVKPFLYGGGVCRGSSRRDSSAWR